MRVLTPAVSQLDRRSAARTVRQPHVSLQHASALAAAATAAAEDRASRAAADLREQSGRVEALRDELAAAGERVIRFAARAHAHDHARARARAQTHTRTAMRAHAPSYARARPRTSAHAAR